MNILQNKILISRALLFVFALDILSPTVALALTSGPSQPEMHSFEPVSTNQMVDLFSGDFTYNIPLLTVPGPNGGYPINMAYHSGIGMEQEASWVGLGWSLSPGVINRQMRGVPDDFNGAKVTKKQYLKPNRTYSAGLNALDQFEFFGLDANIGLGVSINYNNYKGVGLGVNFSPSLVLNKKNVQAGIGANFEFDPYSGLGYSSNLSLSGIFSEHQVKLGLNAGIRGHAIEGYQGASIGYRASKEIYKREKKKSMDLTSTVSAGGSFSFRPASTFFPSGNFPMNNKSITVSLKPGFSLFGSMIKPKINATYSQGKVHSPTKTYSTYGYMNLHKSNKYSLIDYNRENRPISPNTRYLPFPNPTFDIYSVKAQGVGGVYRICRNERSKLHSPAYKVSSGSGASIDVEAGFGAGAHIGGDVYFTESEIEDKPMKTNQGDPGFSTSTPYYEPFFFKSMVENNSKHTKNGKRIARINNMNYRTIEEMESSPLFKEHFYTNYGTFINSLEGVKSNLKKQIGELSVTNVSGSKYVYGIPVYNNKHDEYLTAINSNEKIQFKGHDFANVNNSHFNTSNKKGNDHFYSQTHIPKYSYAYLLTSILSDDYIDLTNNGPSDDDLGGYIRFGYEKPHDDYKWRAPFVYGAYSEAKIGLKTDDKASLSYGEKELYYLNRIETRSHIAKFTTFDRNDGYEAHSLFSDSTNLIGSKTMKGLKRIDLYSKHDTITPIKSVHFEYNYSLCPGVLNNIAYPDTIESGKLTLKKVYFTYGNSIKSALNPYTFEYSDVNPPYKQNAADRWGNYKAPTNIPNKRFPYSIQGDKTLSDHNVQAWNLTKIGLPSSGEIAIHCEGDDYQYVQDRKAQQMLKIKNIDYSSGKVTFSHPASQVNSNLNEYINNVSDVYFKVYNKLKEYPFSHPNIAENNGICYDYIEGYATVNQGSGVTAINDSTAYFYVNLVKETGQTITPFQQAAINHLKLTRGDVLTNPPMPDDGSYNVLEGLYLSVKFFVGQVSSLLSGYYNYAISNQFGYGGDFSNDQYPSMVRLNIPSKQKFGGGLRVKEILVKDNWDQFTGNSEVGRSFGKKYTYQLTDGSSSGVAENEPILGEEESSLRRPFRSKSSNILLNDEIMTDKIVASSVLPSSSVGYSRVIEESIHTSDTSALGSGIQIHEFYTAKDFPFKVSTSSLSNSGNNGPVVKGIPWGVDVFGSTSIDKKDYNQHYQIEKNNMHGQIKGKSKYRTGTPYFDSPNIAFEDQPFAEKTIYKYFTKNKKLTNQVPTMRSPQEKGKESIGVYSEKHLDTRDFHSNVYGIGMQLNVDLVGIIPIPSGLPRISESTTHVKTAVSTEVINKNGILKEVINQRDGTYRIAKNEYFDPITGRAIKVSNNNEHKDKIIDYNIPAHWFYPQMNAACENENARIKFNSSEYTNTSGVIHIPNLTTQNNIFSEGDQLLMNSNNSQNITWVDSIFTSPNGISSVFIKNANGTNLPNISGDIYIRILKSGNKNLLNIDAGYIQYLDISQRIPMFPAILENSFNGISTPDLTIKPELNPINRKHIDCKGQSQRSSINTFFNADTVFETTNTSIYNTIKSQLSDNSFVIFKNKGGGNNSILNPKSIELPHIGLPMLHYECKAEIKFPKEFIDTLNHFGTNHLTFGNLSNYEFKFKSESEVYLNIVDPIASDTFKYICEWSDPNFCFDVCEIPLYTNTTTFENNWTDKLVELDQITGENGVNLNSANISKYRYGLKGRWKQKANYTYNVPRTQSGHNGHHTNIKEDGSYSRFHFFNWEQENSNPHWDKQNEITKQSPYGYGIEQKNSLNIHSSILYGYDHSLVIASAANAQYFEIGVENFEEFPSQNNYLSGSGNISFQGTNLIYCNEAHSGNRALKGESKLNIPSVDKQDFSQATNLSLIQNKPYLISFWTKEDLQNSTSVTFKQNNNLVTLNNQSDIVIDRWKKHDYYYTPNNNISSFEIFLKSNNGKQVIIDDIRINPFYASVKNNVYNSINYRNTATLDDQNLTTFYSYDQEGKLSLVKKETSEGIQTIKSAVNNLKTE